MNEEAFIRLVQVIRDDEKLNSIVKKIFILEKQAQIFEITSLIEHIKSTNNDLGTI